MIKIYPSHQEKVVVIWFSIWYVEEKKINKKNKSSL